MKRPPANTPRLYAQDGKGYDATVFAHYFLGGNDWLVTEYDPVDDLAFGWACLNGDRHNAELGYFSLAEMSEVRGRLRVVLDGVPVGELPTAIELEEDWRPCNAERGDSTSGRKARTVTTTAEIAP